MKSTHVLLNRHLGYCLVELMLVLALIGIFVGAGVVACLGSVPRGEARGCAQSWQAAAALAQIGVMWQGGRSELTVGAQRVRVAHDSVIGGLALEGCVPMCSIDTNVSRWLLPEGVRVAFGGYAASPDSGGSVYFGKISGSYRVIVRPETGLTIRSWTSP